LRSGPHAGEIRVLAVGRPRGDRFIGFFGLPLDPAFLFFFLLGLLGPLAVAFCESRFSWSWDSSLPA